MNKLVMVGGVKCCFKANISLLDHVASDVGATDCSPAYQPRTKSKGNDLRTNSGFSTF
jgi:hypothetical protein